MRKNQRINGVLIMIVLLSMCLAFAVLGQLIGAKRNAPSADIASDVAAISVDENLRENYLSEKDAVIMQTSRVVKLVDNQDGGIKEKAGEVVDKVTDKFDEILKSDILPLITGLATGLMTVLALIVPYIKTLGKLKSTQSAYATVYDEHEKLISLAKEFDTENVKKDIIEKVVEEVETKFIRYDKALGQVLGQEEIISAQLTSLIEGAKLAWRQADGASVILAKTPTATVVEKQALAIEFLKTIIANELGLKKEELESKMNKELAK